jgi:hypothetical protein
MRLTLLLAALIATCLSLMSCGTVYRYEHYDYSEPTIDEKNDARDQKMLYNSRGRMQGADRMRWR